MAPRLKRSGIKKYPPAPQNRWDNSVTHHDESGQVYSEVSCAGTSMTADWMWKTDITAEALEEIPETIGVALWDRLVAARLDSIHLFLAFTKTYQTIKRNRRYHMVSHPNLPLAVYLKSLTSPNYQWLTQLSLLHITVPRTALIRVSLVPNLAVLTLGPGLFAPDIGVDDTLLRTWSRSASTGASFSALRVLALRGQFHLVTPRAFSYLTLFPALSVFAAESASGISPRYESHNTTALAHGWKYRSGRDPDDGLMKGCRRTNDSEWDKISKWEFTFGGKINRELAIAEAVEGMDALPTAHLALGGVPSDTQIAACGEGVTRVWYRSAASQTSNETQLPLLNGSSGGANMVSRGSAALPSSQTVPQKRAPGPQEDNVAAKKAKPTVRASKQQDLGDLLSGFGT